MKALRRWSLVAALGVGAAVALAPRPARAISDPSLEWRTIETPHFKITYHSGIEPVAQRVASVCEGIHDTMRASVGWTPHEKTEILLQDFAESANGSATALPYNQIHLLVTAPEDLSPLGDVDDWYLELVTHEYTHVLHTDQIRGLPTIVNAVLGKTLAPNQTQPRWILEGLAVYQESARTSAGRIRNSLWDMWMRADVLEGHVATIDQVSNITRRWPQGNLFYLYGSYFIDWIARTYGEEALRKLAYDYGSQLIPWGFNRSARRATGKTFIDLYPEWIASMQQRYRAQADEVKRKGVREGVRLTHHGQTALYPRWIPKGAWPEHEGGLLYFREDQRRRPGLWALDVKRTPAGAIASVDEKHAENVARTSGESYASFLPDGGVVFSSQEFEKNVYSFYAIEKLAPGARSSYGTPDGGRTMISRGWRTADPAPSPDGDRIVFTINKAGTRSIHIAKLEGDEIVDPRPLVPTAPLEQAFTPKWSPDGTHVAYSVWKPGGYRDIRYVDVRDGSFRDVMIDRAVDGGPSFSPDGRFLFFHSDRTGIANVYAWEIETGRTLQVTNVINGAYQPEVSPDGKTLAYVGYTTDGFDLYAMKVEPETWPEAEPYVDDRPPFRMPEQRAWDSQPYNPWPTLLPRRYGVQITEGSFGKVVTMTASATDIAQLHTLTVSTTTELEHPELQGSIGYLYSRLPFDFSVSGFRTITPRAFNVGTFKTTTVQENAGFASSVAYAIPRGYDTSSFVFTHALSRVGSDLSVPVERLDPYETPNYPYRGLASSIHLGYAFTNAERYLWSVGNERGFSFSVAFDLTDPLLGSDFQGYATNADFTTYYAMPWLRHHSLALHLGGGTSGGSFPGRGAFFIGSFVDLPLVDTIRNVLIQGGVVLRGYPPVIQAGRSYTLGNVEYRFPIVNVDRGPSTLPVFLNRINGNVFFDYGSAFDDIHNAQYKSGVGAELWSDWTLGYIAAFTFRLGYAKGLASGGIDKVYFVAAIPY
jgi:hypothetical protein